MPTTPGIVWQPTNSGYSKKPLARGVSYSQIQWLNYVQTTDLCIDSQGNRIPIEHAYYRGEIKEGPYYIDGFFTKNGLNYYLEFLGCYEWF